MRRTKYSQEFKIAAVKMVTEEDRRATEVERNLGITPGLLGRWKRQFAVDGVSGSQTGLREELKALRKENKRLKQEREILKKAAAFFARDSA